MATAESGEPGKASALRDLVAERVWDQRTASLSDVQINRFNYHYAVYRSPWMNAMHAL